MFTQPELLKTTQTNRTLIARLCSILHIPILLDWFDTDTSS